MVTKRYLEEKWLKPQRERLRREGLEEGRQEGKGAKKDAKKDASKSAKPGLTGTADARKPKHKGAPSMSRHQVPNTEAGRE